MKPACAYAGTKGITIGIEDDGVINIAKCRGWQSETDTGSGNKNCETIFLKKNIAPSNAVLARKSNAALGCLSLRGLRLTGLTGNRGESGLLTGLAEFAGSLKT